MKSITPTIWQSFRAGCTAATCLTQKQARMPLLALALGAATIIPASAQDPFNILANDPDNHFKPTITITQHSCEKLVVERSEEGPSFSKDEKAEQLTAVIVANLVEFNFSEIAPDMEVELNVGGFEFSAALEDATKLDLLGKSARYALLGTFPPAKPEGEPRIRTVGSVIFSWTSSTLTVRLALANAQAAELASIVPLDDLVTEGSFDEEKGGVRKFANRPVNVTVAFGTATGFRSAYAAGQIANTKKRLGSEKRGNLTIVDLNSAVLIGRADTANPLVAADVPNLDENRDGKVSFNSVITDLPPNTLSDEASPLRIRIAVDDVEMLPISSEPEEGDEAGTYILQTGGTDARGRTIISVKDLPLTEPSNVQPGARRTCTVDIYIYDASGNLKKTSKQIGIPGIF